MPNDIGKKIQQLRKSKKLTQGDIAAKINTTRSTISNYERGYRTPRLKDLEKLCKVFSVSLDYFGISEKDEAVELLERAKEVFNSPFVENETKEALYHEFMRLYLDIKRSETN